MTATAKQMPFAPAGRGWPSCGRGLYRRSFVNATYDGTWKDILQAMATLSGRPLLIVTSRLADDYLWVEVLNLGGYDVLAKPWHHKEVARAIASALEHWSQQPYRRELVTKAGNAGSH